MASRQVRWPTRSSLISAAPRSSEEAFTKATVGQFGSGRAWLVKDHDGKLRVTSAANADLPLKHGQTSLFTCDAWEHAYYLDYRNLRPKYVEAFLAALVNWDFAAENFARREAEENQATKHVGLRRRECTNP